MSKLNVLFWAFHDGLPEPESEYKSWINRIRDRTVPYPRGYSCWVYTTDVEDFLYWMKENMVGSYDATPRFNSGDPMITVFIKEDRDATAFTLKWR